VRDVDDEEWIKELQKRREQSEHDPEFRAKREAREREVRRNIMASRPRRTRGTGPRVIWRKK
jgi:hypothetical protein